MVKKVLRTVLAGGCGLAMTVVVVACGGDEGICPKVGGVFEPLYLPRNGTCGPVSEPYYVPIWNDIQIQKFASVDVETETIVMGCSIKMTQIVRNKMGIPERRIDGSALDVESSNKVQGMITLTQYDALGQPICWGEYDAMLEKNTETLGGATAGR